MFYPHHYEVVGVVSSRESCIPSSSWYPLEPLHSLQSMEQYNAFFLQLHFKGLVSKKSKLLVGVQTVQVEYT